MRKAPIIYIPEAFPLLDMSEVRDVIPWEQRGAPRAESFMADRPIEYTYGRGAGTRVYTANYPYPRLVADIQHVIEGRFIRARFDMCFANYYAGAREHLGWHQDDSPIINHTIGIAIVSLGATREIWFRKKGETEIAKLALEHGSLLYMEPGMQSDFQHRIPKHSAECGPRLSLTFRALRVAK